MVQVREYTLTKSISSRWGRTASSMGPAQSPPPAMLSSRQSGHTNEQLYESSGGWKDTSSLPSKQTFTVSPTRDAEQLWKAECRVSSLYMTPQFFSLLVSRSNQWKVVQMVQATLPMYSMMSISLHLGHRSVRALLPIIHRAGKMPFPSGNWALMSTLKLPVMLNLSRVFSLEPVQLQPQNCSFRSYITSWPPTTLQFQLRLFVKYCLEVPLVPVSKVHLAGSTKEASNQSCQTRVCVPRTLKTSKYIIWASGRANHLIQSLVVNAFDLSITIQCLFYQAILFHSISQVIPYLGILPGLHALLLNYILQQLLINTLASDSSFKHRSTDRRNSLRLENRGSSSKSKGGSTSWDCQSTGRGITLEIPSTSFLCARMKQASTSSPPWTQRSVHKERTFLACAEDASALIDQEKDQSIVVCLSKQQGAVSAGLKCGQNSQARDIRKLVDSLELNGMKEKKMRQWLNLLQS